MKNPFQLLMCKHASASTVYFKTSFFLEDHFSLNRKMALDGKHWQTGNKGYENCGYCFKQVPQSMAEPSQKKPMKRPAMATPNHNATDTNAVSHDNGEPAWLERATLRYKVRCTTRAKASSTNLARKNVLG